MHQIIKEVENDQEEFNARKQRVEECLPLWMVEGFNESEWIDIVKNNNQDKYNQYKQQCDDIIAAQKAKHVEFADRRSKMLVGVDYIKNNVDSIDEMSDVQMKIMLKHISYSLIYMLNDEE